MENIDVVAIRMVKEREHPYGSALIDSPEAAYKLLCAVFDADSLAEENLWIIMLDGARHVIAVQCVARGTINCCMVHPREVFKAAILANSASIILAHNHPSGNLTAGTADRETSTRSRQAGDLLGINLDDHLIVSSEGFASAL